MAGGTLVQVTQGKGTKRVPKFRRYRAIIKRRPYNKRLYIRTSKTEYKNIDRGFTSSATTTGISHLLTGMVKGDDIGKRIGRKITLKSVQIKGTIKSYPSSGVAQVVRILLVYAKRVDGVEPPITDLVNPSNIHSLRNTDFLSKYTVLFDKTMFLSQSGQEGSIKQIKMYKKINLPQTFDSGNDGDVKDIQTGPLYLFAFGTEVQGTTSNQYSILSRVWYTDA